MIVYEPYSPELKDSTVALLMQHWGRTDALQARAFFEWRYEDNPVTDGPCILVAREGTEVVGLRCFVIQTFSRGTGRFSVACPADAIVHPGHRRRGIFRELTLRALDHLEALGIAVVLNLSANRYSAPAASKLGWQEVGMTRYMYRAGRAGIGTASLKRRPRGRPRNLANIRVGPLDDVRLPKCRHPRTGDQQITNVRNDAFRAWRYREPDARFTRVLVDDGDRRGHLILKQSSARLYSVMEYGCDDAGVLTDMAEAFSRQVHGLCVLRMMNLALDPGEAALFTAAGFFYEPRWLIRALGKHRVGALVRRIPQAGAPATPRAELLDAENWFLVQADVH